MAVNADTLLDRMRLKEQLTRWRVIAIIALVLVVIVATQRAVDIDPITGASYIARLRVNDIIVDDTYRGETLEDIAENENVKALIVWIDSPGGTVVGGVQLHRDLQMVAEKKPVVAVIRTLGTSAAYMIALGTNHIVAQEGSITGSIGVIMQTVEFTELANKLGIEPITIKSGPLKAVPSPLEDLTPEGRESIRTVIMDFHNLFVAMVAEGRNLPLDQARSLSDGRIFTGNQALEEKLVDAIGGEKEALSWLESEKGVDISLKIKDVKINYPKADWLEEVGSLFGGGSPMSGLLGQQGLVSIWQPDLK